VDQPSSPRIPEDTYLGHLFYNKTSTTPTPVLPPPVKLLILIPRSQQIPCHLSLQARGKIHKQTLVQETQVPLQLCFPFPKPKEPLKTEKKRVSFADLKAVACDPQPDLHNVDAAANDIFAVFCLQISWN